MDSCVITAVRYCEAKVGGLSMVIARVSVLEFNQPKQQYENLKTQDSLRTWFGRFKAAA